MPNVMVRSLLVAAMVQLPLPIWFAGFEGSLPAGAPGWFREHEAPLTDILIGLAALNVALTLSP
jgi:hypothetical protein